MRKIITSTLMSLLACTLFSCGSDSLPSGDLCPDNAKGRYANDRGSEVMIDTIISPSIADSRVCPDAYPVCHATFCARCEVKEIWVTDDEQVSRCMTCEELSNCHSESCETAKTRCGSAQNKCSPGCRDGNLITCDDDKETTEPCPNGCDETGNACKTSTECTPGCRNGNLITCDGSQETTEPCPNGCDDNGKACKAEKECTPGCRNGNLITCDGGQEKTEPCPNGCDDNGNACKAELQCNDNEVISGSKCVCDKSHGWIGEPDNCKCNEADGYKPNGKLCEAPVECNEDKEVYNPSTGTCECDEQKHFSGTAGKCICADGYADILGQCMFTGVVCDVPHTIYDPQKNKCVCDAEGHWRGTQTGCVCEDGYTEVDGVCQ
ncbi:MAG: hypothetical protein IJU23_10665 [Proteobacteria bacterium]|nr:hypothetical protein [Pseudomonadota bacterium]